MKSSMEKTQKSRYWFKARNYGWGWTPSSWQGWLVVIIFIILESLLATNTDIFIVGTFVLVGVLILICYKKGEKPRWRWGGKK